MARKVMSLSDRANPETLSGRSTQPHIEHPLYTEKIQAVHRDEAMHYIKPILDGYRSHWDSVYVGVTTEPKLRYKQHTRNGWEQMVVLYEAYRADIAIDLERDLIDYAHRCRFRNPITNINPGGESLSTKETSHFLYILLKDKRL
ncbi:hypothetical protein [Archangium primigenium]|uniref:hypothetical protein n=1 Tax=[Archangium] primigenium TaxID=2792470 RepID=UPI00195DE6BE|nr:hypothetical protein [Archangium primigenium]MBM7112474.1 hypothetical protein [Archangium primigenium]